MSGCTCGETPSVGCSSSTCQPDCESVTIHTVKQVLKSATEFVLDRHAPSRIYISSDIAELTIPLDRRGGLVGKNTTLVLAVTKKKRCYPKNVTPDVSTWICKVVDKRGVAHFEVDEDFFTDKDKYPAGLYIGVLMQGECVLDNIEIVKAAGIYIANNAEIHADVCVPGDKWVEPACMEVSEEVKRGIPSGENSDSDNCFPVCGGKTVEVEYGLPLGLGSLDVEGNTGCVEAAGFTGECRDTDRYDNLRPTQVTGNEVDVGTLEGGD